MKTGPSLVDITAGYNAAIGILAAVVHRMRTGRGQHIDVALLDVSIAMQSHVVEGYLLTGEQPQRRGNSGNGGHPAAVFPCADGLIYISAGNQHHYELLCDVLGLPELKSDARFRTSALRFENRGAWNSIAGPRIRNRAKAELAAALVATRVPASVVNSYDDVFSDPHVIDRGVKVELSGSNAPDEAIHAVANPIRLSETPVLYRSAPPKLGEHTREVLSGMLDLTEAEIRRLEEEGAI